MTLHVLTHVTTPEASGYGALVLAFATFAWAAYKDVKGGGLKRTQAEAAKESLDAEAAAASMPMLQESIRLGNWAEAMALQQQHINGLQDQLAAGAERERAKDKRIDELEARIQARDQRIDELEERLGQAETHLDEARSIIKELRAAPDHTTPHQ
jgi:chromosome segregation ATPase